MTRRAILLTLVAASLCLGACTPHVIPNTDVEDTAFNRGVLEFCEEYRRAVERRNTALLLKLAHPDYYEDGGNIDSSDDLDYGGLRDYLKDRFARTKAIRYEVRYRRVRKGRKDHVFVDYTYSASYKIVTKKGEEWRRSVADNRLELIPHGETYRIKAGM